MDDRLRTYTGYTLIDITCTGVTRGEDELLRNQQRNWETVLQTIGLRSQPLDITHPRIFRDVSMDRDNVHFGEFYAGTVQDVWAWKFSVEHEDVFREGDDPIALLKESFNQIPIILGLTETARFMLPIFYTSGAIKNIYFEMG